ncbi:MAG: c-di-GMP-binding flagellar brake protein YcgR [Actinomycetia bacterium]|nr:c-di-GMP-binding flagellar brake protein YcgR [Actinomycetes bacterium]
MQTENVEAPIEFVVDGVNGDRITLSAKAPGATAGHSPFHVGEVAHLQYVDRFGVYEVDTPVLHAEGDSVVVALAAEPNDVRRRVYARLRAPLDATCLLLDAAGNTFTQLDASVVDIGGGGAALAVPAIAPTGATLVCSLAIPGDAPIVTIGNVLAPDADPRDVPDRRHVRVQFTLIAETDRDRLLRFILEALRNTRA